MTEAAFDLAHGYRARAGQDQASSPPLSRKITARMDSLINDDQRDIDSTGLSLNFGANGSTEGAQLVARLQTKEGTLILTANQEWGETAIRSLMLVRSTRTAEEKWYYPPRDDALNTISNRQAARFIRQISHQARKLHGR